MHIYNYEINCLLVDAYTNTQYTYLFRIVSIYIHPQEYIAVVKQLFSKYILRDRTGSIWSEHMLGISRVYVMNIYRLYVYHSQIKAYAPHTPRTYNLQSFLFIKHFKF